MRVFIVTVNWKKSLSLPLVMKHIYALGYKLSEVSFFSINFHHGEGGNSQLLSKGFSCSF